MLAVRPGRCVFGLSSLRFGQIAAPVGARGLPWAVGTDVRVGEARGAKCRTGSGSGWLPDGRRRPPCWQGIAGLSGIAALPDGCRADGKSSLRSKSHGYVRPSGEKGSTIK